MSDRPILKKEKSVDAKSSRLRDSLYGSLSSSLGHDAESNMLNGNKQPSQPSRNRTLSLEQYTTVPTNKKDHAYEMKKFQYTRAYDDTDDFAADDHYQTAASATKTGRQRKKLAARLKGSDFQQRIQKKRIYFCCVSNEIDLEELYDAIGVENETTKWQRKMYEDVLHLYIPTDAGKRTTNGYIVNCSNNISSHTTVDAADHVNHKNNISDENINDSKKQVYSHSSGSNYVPIDISSYKPTHSNNVHRSNGDDVSSNDVEKQNALQLHNHAMEVFIYAFGAAVFWNFSRGEEAKLLNTIREYVVKTELSDVEFLAGQDDMAFVTDADALEVTIANDVVILPDTADAKMRLSVSFAIAQSSVLAIFESRVNTKIYGYQYIPETLAASGKVKLSAKQLGLMIGDVYVIRHDVNLHTEILDMPDFFWKQSREVENCYIMATKYLEMDTRTEVLNKRLDMLRELLNVLQNQAESSHAVKLEWIVIWLIITSIVLEIINIIILKLT